MGQGRNFGRCVVQRGGVAMATITAAKTPPKIPKFREYRTAKVCACRGAACCAPVEVAFTVTSLRDVSQHSTPMSIIESPRMFRTSTRRRSVHGDQG